MCDCKFCSYILNNKVGRILGVLSVFQKCTWRAINFRLDPAHGIIQTGTREVLKALCKQSGAD